jgi:hypothetical protein
MPNLWRGEPDSEIATALAQHYPTLQLTVRESRRVIRGVLNVEHDGHFLGGFQIEVLLDERDVLGLPKVKEVGGRVPRALDRHVNVTDGVACLYLPEDLVVRRKEPFDIISFLEGPVRNFFLGQLGFENGTPFPLGEWGHGPLGVKQMLAEMFGSGDIHTCVAFLELLSGKVIKGHWACPCGSRRVLRACHGGLVRRLRDELSLPVRRFLLDSVRAHFEIATARPRTQCLRR